MLSVSYKTSPVAQRQQMRYFISATLLVAAVIHMLPVVGVMGSTRLSELYGITVGEQNIEILMRHRAVLFGLLGVFLVYAAFNPRFQAAAFIAGLVSVGAFLLLALSVGQYNSQLSRVVIADIVALVFLIAGAVALALSTREA
jgi:hypothetical protein